MHVFRGAAVAAAVLIALSACSESGDTTVSAASSGEATAEPIPPLSADTIKFFQNRSIDVQAADAKAEAPQVSYDRALFKAGETIKATQEKKPLEMALTRFTNRVAGPLSADRKSITSLTYDHTLAWILIYPEGNFPISRSSEEDAIKDLPITYTAGLYMILDAVTGVLIQAGSMPVSSGKA